MKKIGIFAITPEGGALAFQNLNRAFYNQIGRYQNPEIILYIQPLKNHVESFGHVEQWTELLQKGIDFFKNNHVDLIWMPANSSHLVINHIDFKGIEFVNMVSHSIDFLMKKSDQKILILGTSLSLSDRLYLKNGQPSHIIVPDDKDKEFIDKIIFNELILGEISRESRAYILEMIQSYKVRDNINSVFFACTELPCFFDKNDVNLSIYNSINVAIDQLIKLSKQYRKTQ
jgi:aspartate racemase